MYALYAEGLRFFLAGVRFAFVFLSAGEDEDVPCCKAARIIRPNSSSVKDKNNHLSYRRQLTELRLP